MATQQLMRQIQSTGMWSKVFPAEQNTLQESEVFVKKLLIVGLSSITYLRTIFPESSYHEQHLDGLKLKVLRDNTNCRTSNTMVSWMRGCCEAIEKRYLRQLIFAILNKDNLQEAHETYTYKFRYTDAGTVISGPGTPDSAMLSNETRQATEKMLRTIILLTQTMGPLPKSICLSIKLGYYDDVTPKDYEPPSFGPSEDKPFTFRSKPVTIKVGSASTKFHAMKLYVCVEKNSYPTGENSPIEDQIEEEQQQELWKGTGTGKESNTVVRSFSKYAGHLRPTFSASASSNAVSVPRLPHNDSQKDDHQVPTQSHVSNATDSPQNGEAFTTLKEVVEDEEERMQSSNTDSAGSESFPVRCPCGVSCDHGLMILCDICQKWQHGACFNVLEDSEVKTSHVCEECASPGHPCTDPTLPQQPELMSYCLFRRALVLLKQIKSHVTAASLAQQLGVDITMGNHLWKQLKKQKIVYVKNKINRVNYTKLLCDAFPKYLKGHGKPRSQEVVDLTSQTQQTSESLGDFDPDETPDLDVASLQESVAVLKSQEGRESLNNTLDDTLDIMSITQDITVGTQAVKLSSEPCPQLSQSDTYSEALATAGNTFHLLDSPPESSQKAQNHYSASMPLHSGMDVEEGSAELLGSQESSETQQAQKQKMSLGMQPKRGRGRPQKRATRRTMKLSDFEISLSQESDLQSKNSISQDSEVFGKKRRTHL
ncbi:uncharacterized protein LOC126982597 [Eriocheir sinensis]|uniref:uncharacterized protein LOC126982597 n=1 Tax=Eriocheir sinensis TaxID=95602 RepID=UPI0021C9A167|nr:uncharacterized protein LOC126982597 [Eriocheir sinensis]XP_050690733.1 uncharacterized protein LOC126982597 [Eriocheir sinensis]XP_050690734.1 uncharacterized protein LOC126982597 [Eriocheir sinensis]